MNNSTSEIQFTEMNDEIQQLAAQMEEEATALNDTLCEVKEALEKNNTEMIALRKQCTNLRAQCAKEQCIENYISERFVRFRKQYEEDMRKKIIGFVIEYLVSRNDDSSPMPVCTTPIRRGGGGDQLCRRALSTPRVLGTPATPKNFKCHVTKCSARCKSEETLQAHIDKYHPFSCAICQARFNTEVLLDEHRETCAQFSCEICDQRFQQEHTKNEHKKVHIPNLTFCEICDKEFPNEEQMQTHKKVHFAQCGAVEETAISFSCSSSFISSTLI